MYTYPREVLVTRLVVLIYTGVDQTVNLDIEVERTP